MTEMAKAIKTCKQYSSIMEDIATELDNEGIEYQKASKHEIVVENHSAKEIESIINSLPIPAIVIHLLIDVLTTNKKIFIRMKMK